ncbi:MAG: hypothetical protein VKJ64_13170 [Leptolyngbyaceae bacterium]|nr:hypothetical protein [Leptolyngbyaceae bacterium]
MISDRPLNIPKLLWRSLPSPNGIAPNQAIEGDRSPHSKKTNV